jgi:hypothetical protein
MRATTTRPTTDGAATGLASCASEPTTLRPSLFALQTSKAPPPLVFHSNDPLTTASLSAMCRRESPPPPPPFGRLCRLRLMYVSLSINRLFLCAMQSLCAPFLRACPSLSRRREGETSTRRHRARSGRAHGSGSALDASCRG